MEWNSKTLFHPLIFPCFVLQHLVSSLSLLMKLLHWLIFLFSIAIFFIFYFFFNFHCFVTMSPVSIDAHSSPLCSRLAPFRGPGRPDQRKAVLGGLQVAHAVQRGSERRQQEEGPPVFRVPGSSLCSHRFRGTAAAHRVTVGHGRRWSDCGESALVWTNGIRPNARIIWSVCTRDFISGISTATHSLITTDYGFSPLSRCIKTKAVNGIGCIAAGTAMKTYQLDPSEVGRTDQTRRFVLLRIEFSGPTEKVKPFTAPTSSPAPTWWCWPATWTTRRTSSCTTSSSSSRVRG